ncbi:MAG: sulfotransferase [Anaerolineae bacterium]|nr:sulfotransferase [Anaerolineae bacterium]
MTGAASPVWWARWGPLSAWLAASRPPLSPPILLLSFPRSGSSWLGETLGQAANALYLREPINLSYQADGGRGTVVEIDPARPLPAYRLAATRAFHGIPAFKPGIVQWPDQWRLAQRSQRRVVIKEVNPRACPWFLAAFRPRVVFLVRHPAAVCLSYRRMGWWQGTTPEQWEGHGARQAGALRVALDALREYPDQRIVTYEDLCAEPMTAFRSLFAFCALTWDAGSEAFIQRHTTQGDDAPGSTSRHSQAMPDAWRGRVSAEELAALRRGFAAASLPWYNHDDDW